MLGKIIFSECVMFLNGVLSAPCKPKGGIITTNLIKAQMLLHLGSKIFIAKGETAAGGAANLATIETEGACALGTKIPIGGQFAGLFSNPSEHLIEHLITELSALTAVWILSNTPEHKAKNILGSGWALLEGAHEGLKWAGLWN
jgi:hypothetical protein